MTPRSSQKKSKVPFLIRAIRKIIWIARRTKQRAGRYIYEELPAKFPYLARRNSVKKLDKLLVKKFNKGDFDSNAQLKIALVLRDGTTHPKSSAFIRLIAPLTHTSLKGTVSFKIFDETTSNIPRKVDICIVQRTALDNLEQAKKLLRNLKNNNIKLVVDIDDAFSLIDKTHSEHSEQGGRNEALNYMAKNADQIWVSTKPLARLYAKSNKLVHVMDNTLDKRVWPANKTSSNSASNQPIQMVYMGTATHDADLGMIINILDKVHERYPGKFKLTVIGISKSSLPDRAWIDRLYQPRGGSIYPIFTDWFVRQGPFDVGLCPLVNSPFNKYKSDIKCLDYMGANILPIASDVTAYSTPELDKYTIKVKNENEAWVKVLCNILEDPQKFRTEKNRTMDKAREYLWNYRSTRSSAENILAQLKILKAK